MLLTVAIAVLNSYFYYPHEIFCMSNDNVGWCLIYTKPRQEKKVHIRLTEMNINSFLPTRKEFRVWHDRKKYINVPLFPSYVFIYIENIYNYYSGINVDGALYYVRTGKEIACVSEVVINSIKLLSDSSQDIEVSEKKFDVGQKMIISEGPLTGLSCEIVRFNSMEKLLVRVELLQRNILLTIPIGLLSTM